MDSPPPPGAFRLGAAEGVTPTTWVRRWGQRMPRVPLELVPLGVIGGEEAIRERRVAAGIIRAPREGEGLHVIPLYEETPVVVIPLDHYLAAAQEVAVADLAGEVAYEPVDGVGWPVQVGLPAAERPSGTLGAVQLVAAGVGVLVVPQSLARLHHRKDLTYRPVIDLPPTPVGLAWPEGEESELVEEFIGVVRGRRPGSTRGAGREVREKRTAAQKAAARREFLAQKRAAGAGGGARTPGNGARARRRRGRPR